MFIYIFSSRFNPYETAAFTPLSSGQIFLLSHQPVFSCLILILIFYRRLLHVPRQLPQRPTVFYMPLRLLYVLNYSDV